MSRLIGLGRARTVGTGVRQVGTSLRHVSRSVLAATLSSPLMRWRYGAGSAAQLLIVPQNLRLSDPTFFDEVCAGRFNLNGVAADLVAAEVKSARMRLPHKAQGGTRQRGPKHPATATAYETANSAVSLSLPSPFAIVAPAKDWEAALHGFGWLNDLVAAADPAAEAYAIEQMASFVQKRPTLAAGQDESYITARRVLSWLTVAETLIRASEVESYDLLLQGLDRDLVRLSAAWRNAQPGRPRLVALLALAAGNLALAGREGQLAPSLKLLNAEVTAQILAPGGHVSRNPMDMVEILFDLLPLAQCFRSQDVEASQVLLDGCHALLVCLRNLQMGDGGLARFNGMGPPQSAAVSTVLAYHDLLTAQPTASSTDTHNGYTRMEAGSSVVVMDTGPPPPLDVSFHAHAGCLSFEWSFGGALMLVNAGAPHRGQETAAVAARSTAAHTTLRLNEQSSSELLRNSALQSRFGASPLRGPDQVTSMAEQHDNAAAAEPPAGSGPMVSARHDGYAAQNGLYHTRQLALSEDGRTLIGQDQLSGLQQQMRLSNDLPFALHFHLPPNAKARLLDQGERVRLSVQPTPKDEIIEAVFYAEGLPVRIEPSVFYARNGWPVDTQQIVVRQATFGDTTVAWSFEII